MNDAERAAAGTWFFGCAGVATLALVVANVLKAGGMSWLYLLPGGLFLAGVGLYRLHVPTSTSVERAAQRRSTRTRDRTGLTVTVSSIAVASSAVLSGIDSIDPVLVVSSLFWGPMMSMAAYLRVFAKQFTPPASEPSHGNDQSPRPGSDGQT